MKRLNKYDLYQKQIKFINKQIEKLVDKRDKLETKSQKVCTHSRRESFRVHGHNDWIEGERCLVCCSIL